MLRRDVELLAARLAGDGIVHADHVVAQLREHRAISRVGAGRNAVLAHADDPAHPVLVDALAPWTVELVGPRLVPAVEEVAFVKRHAVIIARSGGSRGSGLSGGSGGPGRSGGDR